MKRVTLKRIDAKIGFGKIEYLLSINWINPLYTLWLNFRTLPFLKAIFLPIWVYGRPRIYCLSGKIDIEGSIKSGMIVINKNAPGAPSLSTVQGEINIFGRIVFRGKAIICSGVKLYSSGELIIGKDVQIMDLCSICCRNSISLGRGVCVSHGSQIMDSNYHFTINLANGYISPEESTISIGESCWIANHCNILGGAVLPDFSVVASGSMINKNLSGGGKFSMFAGCPARIVKRQITRVFNLEIEKQARAYYNNHPSGKYFVTDLNTETLSRYE